MSKAILIDATARAVREVEIGEPGLEDIQRLVGGSIELAYAWPHEAATVEPAWGDTLYVDEEGLLKYQHWFAITVRPDQPLAGNGIIVGKEVVDEHGNLLRHDDPEITVEELHHMVRFV